jgi:hypothetical protein
MVQEAKSPVKNLVRQQCADVFNSGVKGLNYVTAFLSQLQNILDTASYSRKLQSSNFLVLEEL